MEIITFVGLLPLFSQEMKLIGDLNNFFNFDHNIFLLDASADFNQFITSGDDYPKSVYVFDDSNGNIGGLESINEIKSKNTFMVVVPATSSCDSNLNLLNRILDIQRLDTNLKIGIFFPRFTAMEELRKLFQWCKEHLIVHIFSATYTEADGYLNIFSFHPFGVFEVMNVTSSNAHKDFFPSLNFNFRQHSLCVTTFLHGFDEKFWLSAFRVMNATFEIKNVIYDQSTAYLSDEIDVIPIMHSPAKFILYPLMMFSNVVLAPEAEPYSGFSAYLRTFTSEAFFGYSLGAIAAITLSLSAIRYIEQEKKKLFESLMDVLNLLCNDNGYINYQRLSRAEVFLVVPLTFLGFVIVNGIWSNLQSYLTRPVLQPQIDTIEDLYNSPIAVATLSKFWRGIVLDTMTSRSKHDDWSDKIIALDSQEFFEKIFMFNTSTSYVLSSIDVNNLLNAQKRLVMKGFYNTGIQITDKLYSYSVSERFLFIEKLNEIIHWLQGAGLYHYWMSEFYGKRETLIVHLNRRKRFNRNEGTDIERFEFPMTVVYGWIASSIVFAVEIIWKNFSWLLKRSRRPQCN